MGRFINADAMVSTGQGILGNNMFAYCGNNPAMFVDPTGNYFLTFGVETYGTLGNTLRHYTGGGSISSTFSIATSKEESEKVIEREIAYFTNTSEEVVLEASGIAFYNGVPVFKADLGEYGGAFSFGIIVMDDYYTYNELGINTLKHEYGHRKHFDQIGPVAYLITTAIPSLTFAALTNADYFPRDLYYSLPWEYVADIYGGVDRGGYESWAEQVANIYWPFASR